MKVLITGGCGFIGSHVAERFSKEGHEICVIDNLSTGVEANLGIKHKLYKLNVADKNCEEVFRVNNFDCVVHLAAQVDVTLSNQDAYLDSESNILGLINMLELSHKYKVKKFLFASSAAVYGDTAALPIKEGEESMPLSLYGINKSIGEYYCRRWNELFGLETVILRFANVYGPRQGLKGETGVISIFMQRLMDEEELVIYGDGTQTRDYIFVEDVTDAVYRAASSAVSRTVMNVSTNTERSLLDVVEFLSGFKPVQNIRHEEKKTGDIYRSSLDNSLVQRELGWMPKYSLQEGLRKTCQWYQDNWTKQEVAAAAETGFHIYSAWKPYVENMLLFVLMALFSYNNLYGGFIDYRLGLDYSYLYIGVMGILYGKRQSLIATSLSALLFIVSAVIRGADFVSIMYQAQYLTHLAAYLCVGVVTGYVRDNWDRIAGDQQLELDAMTERYHFLRSLYLDCNQIKDAIHSQVVNSTDSIGKIYSIVRELDSLRIEDIYTAAIGVVGKVMQAQGVALYSVNKGETYWRLKVRSQGCGDDKPNSLRIEDHEYARTIMKNKTTFVNRSLQADAPIMAAPVLYEDKVIAVVSISGLPFENMTTYHENLFNIVIMLVKEAFTKAYLYDRNLQDKMYITGTGILVPEEFVKILSEIENRRQSYQQEMLLLKITDTIKDYGKAYQSLAAIIRDEDYVGLQADGHIYILMLNIPVTMMAEITQRLAGAGFHTIVAAGDKNV